MLSFTTLTPSSGLRVTLLTGAPARLTGRSSTIAARGAHDPAGATTGRSGDPRAGARGPSPPAAHLDAGPGPRELLRPARRAGRGPRRPRSAWPGVVAPPHP